MSSPLRIAAVATIAALFIGLMMLAAAGLPSPSHVGAPVAASPKARASIAPESSARPTSDPAATLDPVQRGTVIDWDSGSVRLEAESYELVADGPVISGRGDVEIEGYAHQPSYRDFGVTWNERGVEQRFHLHLRTNGRYWWVGQLWAYDGRQDGEWIQFHDELRDKLLRTPVGEPFEGDLHLEGVLPGPLSAGTAKLTIRGLRLTAFTPDSGGTKMTGCTPATEYIPEDQFAGISPDEAEVKLKELGICYEFRYSTPLGAERWCTAPPGGTFEDAVLHDHKKPNQGSDRIIVTYVSGSTPKPGRTPPPAGWGCPTE